MKSSLPILAIFLYLLCSHTLSAQGNNCGNIEPAIQCPMDTTICLMQLTTAPVVTTTSDLPNLEYAVVDYNKPATSGTGPSVVGVDVDGIFMPNDFALMPGSNFGIIPVSYDLIAIQELLDKLLKGDAVPFFLSCCDAAVIADPTVNLCDSLNAAGIYCGSDVTGLQSATALFGGGSGGDTLSIVDLINEINTVNASLNDPLNPPPASCGGGDKIAFAYGNECTYWIVPDTLNVTMPHLVSETAEAVDLVTSTSIVDSPYIIEYNANICIELQPGFETVVGADFTAQIADPCQ